MLRLRISVLLISLFGFVGVLPGQQPTRGDRLHSLPLDVGLAPNERGLLLVENGEPRATIVVSADAANSMATIGLENPDPKLVADKVAWGGP